jgi:C-terminal processing protease CtpA/Prc
MLKDVIVPKRVHKLVVRYSRMSNGATSPRRSRARRVTQQQQQATGGAAPRRIEEIELTVTREKETGKLGFSIDAMNMVVEVEPSLASKLKVGDKVIKVDDELLNYKKFVDVVKNLPEHKLRVARLATAASSGPSQNKKEKVFGIGKKARRASKADAPPPSAQAAPPVQRGVGNAMPALREVRLVKEAEDTKIGAVFHRSDDAFDKSFFNVEGSSVQPIIKKVDPGSMAEVAGLVPGDVVLSVNGISGLSNFQVVEMLRKGHGVFNLVVISGRQVQQQLNAAQQPQG